MSIIDDALKANREYAKTHDRKLALPPAPQIAVVTCMDPRLSNLQDILGLPRAVIDVKGFFSAPCSPAHRGLAAAAQSKAARTGRLRRKRPRGVLELRRACKLKQPLARAPREARCSQPASTSGATALPLS
jgi:hypothetical protein